MRMLEVMEILLDLKFLGVFGKVFIFFCHAIRAATIVRSKYKDEKLYWLHSYVLVLLTGFGGGIITPLFLGKPSMMFANNLLVPISGVAWYLTHNVEGMQEFLTSIPVKLGWGLGHCLFRVFTICNMVTRANVELTPDPYYPIPLVGPVVAGTMTGSLGMFLPFDKGLGVIQHGTPWPIQGALITALTFHILVYDTEGIFGTILRYITGYSLVGIESWSPSEKRVVVRLALLVMWVIMQWGQTLKGPDFNIFQPIYDILYTIFQIENPRDKTLIAMVKNGDSGEPLGQSNMEKDVSDASQKSLSSATTPGRYNTRYRRKKIQ